MCSCRAFHAGGGLPQDRQPSRGRRIVDDGTGRIVDAGVGPSFRWRRPRVSARSRLRQNPPGLRLSRLLRRQRQRSRSGCFHDGIAQRAPMDGAVDERCNGSSAAPARAGARVFAAARECAGEGRRVRERLVDDEGVRESLVLVWRGSLGAFHDRDAQPESGRPRRVRGDLEEPWSNTASAPTFLLSRSRGDRRSARHSGVRAQQPRQLRRATRGCLSTTRKCPRKWIPGSPRSDRRMERSLRRAPVLAVESVFEEPPRPR